MALVGQHKEQSQADDTTVYYDIEQQVSQQMTGMTNQEVREFLKKNESSTGIKVRDRQPYEDESLYYDDPEANAFYLKYPETPRRATYFARLASLLGAEDESMFYGAMLWITLFSIGSPPLEKTGWTMVDMMRRSFGENRPLEAAPGHWFRNGSAVELAAFLLPCFMFGWDAFIVPSGDNFFVHISHDEYWAVVTPNNEVHQKVLPFLEGLEPREDQGLLRQFCPRSKYLVHTPG